jgi:DNA primase
MAKISPVSIKYMIYASFRAEGPLERPDVVGALFGQTEGLLGGDLEMRELQKEGRIGRIEVSLEIVDGKTLGEIRVPTAMDKTETTLIAAALETIDRIGPTEAQIKIEKIQDVRTDKRNYIMDRAKRLLEGMDNEGFGELAKTVKEESRVDKIQEYGDEKLPAGDISGKEIIVVEGRADVVNLLKNRVSNVIGMNGARLPLEIAKLGKEKEITLFVDGDRGGKLIANNVISNASIAYVAVAPDGKEVEELTGKEILISLRKKIDVNTYLKYNRTTETKEESSTEISFSGDVKARIRAVYKEIENSKAVALLDNNLDIIKKVGVKEVARALETSRKQISAVIVDGAATKILIKICGDMNIKYLAAKNFGSFDSSNVELISL